MRRWVNNSKSLVRTALGLLVLSGLCSDAFAQTNPPAPPASSAPTGAPAAPESAQAAPPAAPETALPTPPPPPPATEADAKWKDVYERGKAALATGAFPPAATMLNDVALRASDPTLRAQARELSQLASYWAYNRYRLMPPINTLPSSGDAPTRDDADKRTIDELAILYTNSVLWGTGFGVVVGFAAENADAATFFLPAIAMAGVGAGAVALMDVKYGPLTYGMPQSITAGMYIGLEAGILITGIMESQNAIESGEEKVYPGLMWGSATAGALVGGLIAATTPVTPGRASFTGTGSLWGGLTSAIITIGITNGEAETAPWITGLIGATAGGVTTGLLAKSVSPSIARVRFIDLGGIAGGLVMGGLYASIADTWDGQALAFLTSGGIVGGIALSSYLTRDMERDEPRRRPVRNTSQWRTTPYMTPLQGGGTLGLAGTF